MNEAAAPVRLAWTKEGAAQAPGSSMHVGSSGLSPGASLDAALAALVPAIAEHVVELLGERLAASSAVPTPWLSAAEAADYLRCERKRIYDLVGQQRLPAHRDGSRLLFQRAELDAYGAGLADKPELIGLNKADAMTPREISARRAALARASGRPVMVLSGATGQGVPEVLRALQDTITRARRARAA